MTNIPDAELHKMILKLPPKERQAMGDIIAGRITKRVRCLKCDSVIAEMYNNGSVRSVLSDGESKLLSWRPRLDGFMGFQCACGNYSLLSPAEENVEGIIKNAIDRTTLEEVYTNMKNLKLEYPSASTGDGQIIDGFLLEDIK